MEFTGRSSVIMDMDASDTATIGLRVRGEAGDTVDIYGDSDTADIQTFFSGYLVA